MVKIGISGARANHVQQLQLGVTALGASESLRPVPIRPLSVSSTRINDAVQVGVQMPRFEESAVIGRRKVGDL